MKQKLLLGKAMLKLFPLLIVSLLLSAAAISQKTVTGKVTSASDNQPLAGASVSVKGTSVGTTTGADGGFSLSVPAAKNIIVISTVGYEDVEVDVSNTSTVSASLKSATGSLNEVVVTGYSSQRKKDIIGAVSVVNIADLRETPGANLAAQLQGRATGVTVSGSGAPGSPAVVRIRGFQSGGNNEPLYVIDGVPTQDPSIINPLDVESMQVLKDATASAIYGTRAANGVVIITTKQGKGGRAQVTYETYVGSQNVTQDMRPKMLTTPEYIQYLNKSGATSHPVFGNAGSFASPDFIVVSSAFKGGLSASDPRANPALASYSPLYQILKTSPQGTNWFDEILQSGLMQSHQITAAGGTDKATYSMGLNYFDQDGTIKLTNFKRYTVRANTTLKPTSWLKLGENLQVSYQSTLGGEQRGEGGAWSWAYRMVPYIPVYDITGGFGGNGVGQSGNGSNPIANLIRDQDDKNTTIRLFGNAFAEIQPIKWVTLRTSIGIDVGNTLVKDISRKTYERAENQGTTQLTELTQNFLSWTWSNIATFQKTFLNNHDVKLQAGTEAIKRTGRQSRAFGQNFDLDNADFISLGNAGTASGDRNVGLDFDFTSTIFSLIGRLDYAFKNKYLFNATYRQDEASVFGKNFRVGQFPSVGFGWRISEEKFMESINWISDLKLRGGYGSVGSTSNVGVDNAFATYRTGPGFGNYDLAGTNTSALLGYRASTAANEDTRWETTVTKNIGLDLSILNGKWVFDINGFQNDTKDLLYPRTQNPVGPLIGLPKENIGTMRNTGFEIAATNTGTISRDFKYNATLTFSKYKNKFIKLNEEGVSYPLALDRFSNAIMNDKGLPLSSFWGYKVVGFYNTQAEVDAGPKLAGSSAKIGTWKYLDRNGDGNINSADAGVIGSPHPKFQMGVNLNVEYKQFDFSAFLFWNYGNDLYNYTKWYTDMRGFVGGVSTRVLNNTWTTDKGNNVSLLPILQNGTTQDGFNVPGGFVTNESNSYYIEKGSYLRAKTLQLGYSLNNNIMSRLKLQKIRLYVQAQNLFTITKYTGADPDLSIIRAQRNAGAPFLPDAVLGIDQSGFPNPKQVIFGLSVTF